MALYNVIASLIAIAISAAIALLIYRLLSSSLRRLLDDVIGPSNGSVFYLRAFALTLVLAAFGGLTDVDQADANFMEYVWASATRIFSQTSQFMVVLLIYVGFVTILLSVLRPRNGK